MEGINEQVHTETSGNAYPGSHRCYLYGLLHFKPVTRRYRCDHRGEGADAQTIEAVRKDLGLDKPVIVQYGKYMWNLLHGDMGVSYSTKRPVFTTIMSSFPNTAKLAFWSILVAVAIALPIGIISATRQYSAVDNVGMVAALLGVATPNFWLGLMLIIVFSLNLGILPSGGMSGWKSYIMPAITREPATRPLSAV